MTRSTCSRDGLPAVCRASMRHPVTLVLFELAAVVATWVIGWGLPGEASEPALGSPAERGMVGPAPEVNLEASPPPRVALELWPSRRLSRVRGHPRPALTGLELPFEPEALVELIRREVTPWVWAHEDAHVEAKRGILIVRAPQATLEAIEQLLQDLHAELARRLAREPPLGEPALR